jgi:translation elongation factor EF-G
MGWKGSVRSINATCNRAERDRAKNQRSLDRDLNKVDKEIEQIQRKCHSLETKLEKDIIKALGIQYSIGSGFTSTAFQIQTSLFSGSIDLLNSEKVALENFHFQPEAYELESMRLEALDILVTQWATLVAFKIQHKENDYHLRLNWVKKSEPSESKVYLLDPVNSEYYYPKATDLKGEVLQEHPRVGIIAFEPFRYSTSNFKIYFSNVKLLPKVKLAPFCFESVIDKNLENEINDVIHGEKFTEQVNNTLNSQNKKIKNQINTAHSSGCLIFIILGIIFIMMSVIMSS